MNRDTAAVIRIAGPPTAAILLAFSSGCATGPRFVPPADLPVYEANLAETPDDLDLRRVVASSLMAADRCDDARALTTGFEATADAPWVVLVRGGCSESDGELTEATRLYHEYLRTYPDGSGAPVVRGQLLLLAERAAVARAEAVEPALLGDAPDSVVAILPLRVEGAAERYSGIGRGLAARIIRDFQVLDRFPLVERLSVNAILRELELARSPLVDSTTAPRFGRLVQAGQLVSGAVQIPPDESVRLEAAVVRSSGEVRAPPARQGRLQDILQLQKELVFDLATQLGYTLTEAERQRVLENGTRNLNAFLAHARGLELVDRGSYAAGAAQFAEAYRLDPSFVDAREMLEAAVGAEVTRNRGVGGAVQSAGEASEAADNVEATGRIDGAADRARSAAVNDVAATQSEQATGGAITGAVNPPIAPPELSGVIRLRIPRIPGGTP